MCKSSKWLKTWVWSGLNIKRECIQSPKMLRGREIPDTAASRMSPGIQFSSVVFLFARHGVSSILRLAPLLVLRWLLLPAGANASSFKSAGKEWASWTDNSQQLSQICLHRIGLGHVPTRWPNHWPADKMHGNPCGLNLPRTTLMLTWRKQMEKQP